MFTIQFSRNSSVSHEEKTQKHLKCVEHRIIMEEHFNDFIPFYKMNILVPRYVNKFFLFSKA